MTTQSNAKEIVKSLAHMTIWCRWESSNRLLVIDSRALATIRSMDSIECVESGK